MADVSMPMEVMEAIAERSSDFIWIDHHVSALKYFKAYFQDYRSHVDGGFSAMDQELRYVYEEGVAACELCWKWASDEEISEPVKLLGMYDTWRNQDQEYWNNVVLPFQYGMRVEGFDPKSLSNWIFNDYENNPTRLREVIGIGKAILKYQKEQNTFAMKSSFDARLSVEEVVRCLVCCRAQNNSMSFESKWDEEKYDIMVAAGFNGKNWYFSFYTTKEDFDCSVLAKKFGGGGHKKAAGCASDDIRKVLVF